MKTILYNPIFINPQAYYVFPQLYDIEKGDSFIEPAVYSGYLIIEDLISNTSSQVINTKEVDFTEFAGKRIRISQYTNIGAVVLGEWLLPEGEQSGPSFHQSLVDAWFMSGPSNSDKPSSITGVKGNEIQLKNFAYSLSSGFGKYEIDFNSWSTKIQDSIDISSISITIISKFNNNWMCWANIKIPDFKVEIKGLPNNNNNNFSYRYAKNNTPLKQYINADGVYNLPASEINYNSGFYVDDPSIDFTGLTITQLPSAYEGGLVFDGVDDYGICTGLPILDDYTVICRREIINKDYYSIASKSTVVGEGGFIFEVIQDRTNYCYSFGVDSRINLYNGEISWQTKNSYNGNTIKAGDRKDSDTLTLGIIREGDESKRYLKGAIFYFALYNKSLTPEEIETEKERLNEEWLKRKTE